MGTTPSFRKFDYRIRPAKSAERKMLCQAFGRLSVFEPVENYRYIGFGSTTFVDFILFHKALGITDMISIENREHYESRFEFNRPFQCIQMKYGDSNHVLPELTWDKRTILWLDYERHLTHSELQDIAYVAMRVMSGTMLVVSLNAGNYRLPGVKGSKSLEAKLEKLKEDVGADKVPGDVTGKDLEGPSMARTFRRLIGNEIAQVLRDRNGMCSAERKVEYHPLFNFHYSDQAKMLTVGGVFHEVKDEPVMQQCRFDSLDFVQTGDAFYEIKIPVLTPREQRFLDKKLPRGAVEEAMDTIQLTETEIQNYARVYRYCPTFVEITVS